MVPSEVHQEAVLSKVVLPGFTSFWAVIVPAMYTLEMSLLNFDGVMVAWSWKSIISPELTVSFQWDVQVSKPAAWVNKI